MLNMTKVIWYLSIKLGSRFDRHFGQLISSPVGFNHILISDLDLSDLTGSCPVQLLCQSPPFNLPVAPLKDWTQHQFLRLGWIDEFNMVTHYYSAQLHKLGILTKKQQQQRKENLTNISLQIPIFILQIRNLLLQGGWGCRPSSKFCTGTC